MTEKDALNYLGVKAIRRVSEHTTTVEFVSEGAAPATALEQRMWSLIQLLLSKPLSP